MEPEPAPILKARQLDAEMAARAAAHRKGQRPVHNYEAVVRCWLRLDKTNAVGREMKIQQATVSKILRKCGVTIGKGQRAPKFDLPMDEIISRYLAGDSTWEIGPAYGVEPEVIRRRLHTLHIARRSMIESRARGKKNGFWKHGREYISMHYFRRQSYEVAAICTGQPLAPGTVIHHLDENPHNNSPDNLILFPGPKEHSRFHSRLRQLQRQGAEVDAIQMALENGGVKLPPPPAPIVLRPYTEPLVRLGRPRKPKPAQTASLPESRAQAQR